MRRPALSRLPSKLLHGIPFSFHAGSKRALVASHVRLLLFFSLLLSRLLLLFPFAFLVRPGCRTDPSTNRRALAGVSANRPDRCALTCATLRGRCSGVLERSWSQRDLNPCLSLVRLRRCPLLSRV